MHGVFGVLLFARIWRALIKSHDNVCPDDPLNVHHTLRRKVVLAAIDVRLEAHAFFGDLAVVAQRIHLIAPTVGEDRALPAIEAMQAARPLQNIQPRPKVQVIRVTQNNLCPNIIFQFPLMHCLYRACGSYWHKDGRFDATVIGFKHAGSGFGLGVGML